jgi:hypothetical protein
MSINFDNFFIIILTKCEKQLETFEFHGSRLIRNTKNPSYSYIGG